MSKQEPLSSKIRKRVRMGMPSREQVEAINPEETQAERRQVSPSVSSGLPQGLAAVILASGVAIGISYAVFFPRAEIRWPAYLPWLVIGAMELAAAEVAGRRGRATLVGLFYLFGAWSCLLGLSGAIVAAHIWLLMAGAPHDIFVMAADGSHQTRLTRNAASDASPAWSPDGRRIAFRSMRDGSSEIDVMDADGSNQIKLAAILRGDITPAWSPDGRRIALRSWSDGNQEIYVVDADGANRTRISLGVAVQSSLAWSPDGRRLAFASNRDGNLDIYVADAYGANETRLTRNEAPDYDPAWSPDGRRIAFTSYRDGNMHIYVMDADGANQTRLARGALWNGPLAWSPDGHRIAFQSDRDGRAEIYVMDADGANQTRLTRTYWSVYPAWSPDGSRIAFESEQWGSSLQPWAILLIMESLIFIAWSVPRRSRALLFSGLLFLSVGIVLSINL